MVQHSLHPDLDLSGHWQSERYGLTPSVLMSWRADATGVAIRFDSAPQTGSPLTVELRVVPPVEVTAPQIAARQDWSMARGIPMAAGRAPDLFAQIASWVHNEIYTRNAEERRLARRCSPAAYEAARCTMRQLFARLRSLAVHAAECCDPAARTLALRFPVHLRFPVYQRIVQDGSGRIAQLATTCPGALGFALALMSRNGAAIGERLLSDVIAGRRLNPLLDEAIEAWAAGIVEQAAADMVGGANNPVRRRIAQANTAESARIRAAQRLLIRRAGPAIYGAHLWLPPPIAFAPEDIPRATRANAAWFRVTKAHSTTLVADGEPDAALRFAIARFASCHAPAIWSLRRHSVSVRGEIIELRDYLAASRRFPSTRTDPQALIRASRYWHAEIDRVAGVDSEGGELDPAILDEPFPEPPLPAWSRPGAEVRHIATARELIAEGRGMMHCVASRLREIIAGRCAIYHAEVRGRSLTVEILRRDYGLVLGDFKGIANREPTKTERDALIPWLVGVASDSPASL